MAAITVQRDALAQELAQSKEEFVVKENRLDEEKQQLSLRISSLEAEVCLFISSGLIFSQIKSLNTQTKDLSSRLSLSETSLAAASQRAEETDQRFRSLEAERASSLQQLDSLNAELLSLRDRLRAVETERDELAAARRHLEEELQAATSRSSSLATERDVARKQLDELRSSAAVAKEQLELQVRSPSPRVPPAHSPLACHQVL